MNPNITLIPILGSGGVGKTTAAAALALALGESGQKVVVITVDPAHRLAQALGLETLSNQPKTVKTFANGGFVDALWLDQNNAFEDLVSRHGKEIPQIEKIVQNKLFKIIQSQLGGIEEYLGIERILSLNESAKYTVCVLDTPPSRHALDFLEAPQHLLKFFDEGVLRVFLSERDEKPKGLFSKILQSGKFQMIEIFKNFLGQSFLRDLSDLLGHMKPVHKIFTQTARDIELWTRSPSCHLMLVSLLEKNPLGEAHLLSIELDAKGLKAPSLVILNKCLPKTRPETALLDCLTESGKAFVLGQFALQQKLRAEIAASNPFGAVPLAELPRQSVRQLSEMELLTMGRLIVEQWPNKIM